MTPFDIFVLIVLGLSILYSILRGMVREVFSLVSLLGGYLLAIRYQVDGAQYLGQYIPSKMASSLISFWVIFLGSGFVISLVGKVIRSLVHSSAVLSGTDRMIGGCIGVLKGLVFVAIAMYAMKFFPEFNRQALTDSKLAPHVQKASDWLSKTLVPSELIDRLPKFSLDGVKEQLKKLPDLKDLTKDLNNKSGNLSESDTPQDSHTRKDKAELDKILKSADKN